MVKLAENGRGFRLHLKFSTADRLFMDTESIFCCLFIRTFAIKDVKCIYHVSYRSWAFSNYMCYL